MANNTEQLRNAVQFYKEEKEKEKKKKEKKKIENKIHKNELNLPDDGGAQVRKREQRRGDGNIIISS